MVNCSNCGYNNAPGALLCAHCGVALASAPPAPGAPGQAYPPAPPPSESYPPPGPGEPYPPGPGGGYPPAPGGPGSGEYPPGYPAPGAGEYPVPGSGQYPPGYPAPGSGEYPPGYPPGGLPPGYPPGAGYGGPGGPRKKSQKGLLITVLALLVVAAVGAAAVLVLSGDEESPTEVVLEPVGSTQPDDFTEGLDDQAATLGESVAIALADTPPRTDQVDATLAGKTAPGSEPGLYGGTQDETVCNVDQLLAFFQDEANADKAAAWAEALGIQGGVGGIPDFIGGLTSVRLRFDTRVTNHGFRDGAANPFQSVLQAGTAVMVDANGVPRVKCGCGNPLAPPEVLADVSAQDALDIDEIPHTGDAWEGFDPANVVAVSEGEAVADSFILITLEDGRIFRRPIGTNGAEDDEFNDRGDLCAEGGKLAESETCAEPELGSGDVQVTLRWDSIADLDLSVVEPDGTLIYFSETGPTATGGELDVDSNVGCNDDDGAEGAIENIFWPEGEAPTGQYTVRVTGYTLTRPSDGLDCGSADYTLTIRVAGQDVQVIEGSVPQISDEEPQGEVDTYTFGA